MCRAQRSLASEIVLVSEWRLGTIVETLRESSVQLLVVSDLHYSLKQYDWIYERRRPDELLVIAGDLLDIAGHVDLDTQIVVVEKYLRRLAVSGALVVCSGNHDLDAESPEGEPYAEWLQGLRGAGISVDGQGLTIDGTRISVCPWWEGESGRLDVETFLRDEGDSKSENRWIWIYHAPPSGSKTSWNGKKFSGDEFLRRMIGEMRPDIVIGGHIHNSPFYGEGSWFDRVDGTWVFNPGRLMASTPTCIRVDLDAMRATWESPEGDEHIALSAT
ncbi:MAG: hypothetical protein AMXMBFR84_08090 [Candidatus Hydrogenedentota bacterium]